MSVLLPTEQHTRGPCFHLQRQALFPFSKGARTHFSFALKKYVQCRNAIKYRNLYGVFKSPIIRVGVRGAVAVPGV